MSNYYFFFIFQTKLCFEVSTTNLLVPECMTIFTKHIISVHNTLCVLKRLSITNLSSENNLPMFQLNAPVVIRGKVKKCK